MLLRISDTYSDHHKLQYQKKENKEIIDIKTSEIC